MRFGKDNLSKLALGSIDYSITKPVVNGTVTDGNSHRARKFAPVGHPNPWSSARAPKLMCTIPQDHCGLIPEDPKTSAIKHARIQGNVPIARIPRIHATRQQCIRTRRHGDNTPQWVMHAESAGRMNVRNYTAQLLQSNAASSPKTVEKRRGPSTASLEVEL